MAKFFGLRGKPLEFALIWTVILPSYILFGYNHAVVGGLLSLPSWVQTFPYIDTTNTTGETKIVNSRVQGTVVAIYTLGCFLGCLSCVWVGDKLGRKRTIMLGAAINLIGAVLRATSFSLQQLILGGIITGFGFGHITATAPNWQAECSGAGHRGAAVLLEGVFLSLGLAVSAWIDFGMSYVSGSVSWRFPLALGAFWSVLVLLATPLMPESPRWLVKAGRLDEARAALSALADLEQDSPKMAAAIDEIQRSLRDSGQARLSHLFHNGQLKLLQRTCLAAAGQMFQQISGIGALAFYQATIFEDDLGLGPTQSRILSAAVFTFQFVLSPIGCLTVDRFGRRKLMMFSALGMGICMAVTAAGASQPQNAAAIAAAATFIFLFSFFFPIGFLGMTFLYAAEIAPLSYRVPLTAISMGTAWIFNFIVTEVTPLGFASISYRYFIVYAAINIFLIFPCVWLFFPETNGLRLEEVDKIFLNSQSVLDTVNVARVLRVGSRATDSETRDPEKEARSVPSSHQGSQQVLSPV